MLCRLWRGWTTRSNADLYEKYLKDVIFKEIEEMDIEGYERFQLFRNDKNDEVEFITIMYFQTLEAIKQFVGEDYTQAFLPEKERKLLSRFDERVEIIELKIDQGFK
ncbi:MAG: antibiotic biosynthesis monooxygenase [Candidatus Thorarchaeota archaeon]